MLCNITLASLVKGRWIDGKAQTVDLLRLLAVYPPFYTTSFSAVKTEGLSRNPRLYQPFQNRTILRKALYPCPPSKKGEVLLLGQAEPTMVGIVNALVVFMVVLLSIPIPSHRTTPSKTALSHSLFVGRGACPSRCTEYCHFHYHCKRTTILRFAPSPLPYERSVGFASVAIVVVCGRCVLHRLFATTCKHPCLKPLGVQLQASMPIPCQR